MADYPACHGLPAIKLLPGYLVLQIFPQRQAYSLQSFAEHFRVHSHTDTEVIGQTEEMSRHG